MKCAVISIDIFLFVIKSLYLYVPNLIKMEEKDALRELRDNSDKTAFAYLYNLYWRKVYNFTKLYIVSSLDAEEIVQEVFVKLWENRASINVEQNFAGYLFIIIRNLIFNLSRKKLNEEFYKMSVLEAVEESYDMEGELDAANLKVYIDSLIALLSPRQQEVFRLSRDRQLSHKEIAALLQISEKTVECHIAETLKFLKKNIRLYLLFLSV